MVDKTVCTNNKCPLSMYCFRYKAAPSTYQSWAYFEPFINDKNTWQCDYFLEIWKEETNDGRT